ncbi:MAG: serine protease [Patescibacteria group bacterium]
MLFPHHRLVATVAVLVAPTLTACTYHYHRGASAPSVEGEKPNPPPAEAIGNIVPDAKARPFWERLAAVTVRVRKGSGKGGGSGVIVSKDGLVITAGHVTGGFTALQVARVRLEPDGTFTEYAWYYADLVHVNEAHDIALLRMRDPPKDLSPAPIADISGVKVGDYLYRLGFGDVRLTKGPILHKDVTFKKQEHMLELGLIGGPGASGGPVFDGMGRLVAIELASPRSEGSYPAYALPMKYVLETVMRD